MAKKNTKKNNLSRPSATGFAARLYVDEDLSAQAHFRLSEKQAHYIAHVMRCEAGDRILFFNGRDGEWLGRIKDISGKRAEILIDHLTRDQTEPVDLWLIFAALRGGRSAWLAQKAAEMGVQSICPVFTQYSVAKEVNAPRLRANAIEGAEQSESLFVPEIFPARALLDMLPDWPSDRRLIFCDESLARDFSASALDQLASLRGEKKFAILVGPEGGLTPHERDCIRRLAACMPISLGSRIMRAETAALAALSLFQAALGDW